MNGFSSVTVMGNVTRDPETRAVKDSSVTGFSIAVNEKYKETEKVHFIDCEAWGKTGETIAKFFTKGKPIIVLGKLQMDSWESEGKKFSKLKVNVNNFHFLPDGKKSDETPAKKPAAKAKPVESSIGEDDIPF